MKLVDRLTHSRLLERMTYVPETGQLLWRTAKRLNTIGKAAGTPNSYGYLTTGIDGVSHPVHRLVWFYVHGKWPEGQIDHINGDRTDNRIENLRQATIAQNVRNRGVQRHNKCGFKGVSFKVADKRWRASIGMNGKSMHIGLFDTAEEAARAYDDAAIRHYGEFAKLNFPRSQSC